MKLALFGASGKIGRHLTRQALEAGHEVTALVRSLKADLPEHPNLTLVVGDGLDPDDVAKVVAGQEAVLVALGAPLRNRDGIRARGTALVIEAMQQASISRLICLSGFGVGNSRPALPWIYRTFIMTLILRHVYADHEKQEAIVQKSGLDWTLVRPTNFSEGAETGAYRVDFHTVDKDMAFKITHGDVAHFILSQLADRRFVHQTPAITS